MKPYNELTPRGKNNRLRKLVLLALQNYELDITSVCFLTTATNTMFRVRSVDHISYVMRVYSDEETTLNENRAEMFWLQALVRDTDMLVTEPVARRDGEFITVQEMPGIPTEKRCVLFKWIPGRSMSSHRSESTYGALAENLARLHAHAATLIPLPASIRPKKWDKVFYYPEEPVVFDSPAYAHLFLDGKVEIIQAVIARAGTVFERLYADQDAEILIHGDLHPGNAHVHRADIYIIDFEDVMRGYPIQDIAVSLSYGRQHPDYTRWAAAFKEGYTRVNNWPEGQEYVMETLIAAHSAMFINYVARVDENPAGYINSCCADPELYLQEYT